MSDAMPSALTPACDPNAVEGPVPGMPVIGGWAALTERHPAMMAGLASMTRAIMREGDALPPVERELVAAYVARNTGCDYCRAMHVAMAEALGAGDAARVIERPTEALGPLFDLADRAMADSLTRADITRFERSGRGLATAEAVIQIVSLFAMAERLVAAYGLRPEPSMAPPAPAALPDRHGVCAS